MLLSDDVISITRFGQKSLIEVLHCTFKVSLITAYSIKQIIKFLNSQKNVKKKQKNNTTFKLNLIDYKVKF